MTSNQPKRRNGQLPSCEPCRIAKIRCDHGQPHCSRCVKRDLTGRCYYHPAPLTSTEQHPQKKQRRQTPIERRPPRDLHPRPTSSPASPSVRDGDFDSATGLVDLGTCGLPFDTGATLPVLPREFASLTKDGVSCPPTASRITEYLVFEGAKVLEFVLSSLRILEPVLDALNNDYSGGFCGNRVFAHAVWGGVREADQILGGEAGTSAASLQALSRRIFENTSRPLQVPATLAERGIAEMILGGAGLRWETIGLCCTFLSRASYAQAKQTQIGEKSPAWKELMKEAVEHTLQCERICDRLDQVNDLTVQLLVYTTPVPTWCYGDDCWRSWRLVGDIVSALMALNYHKGFQHSGDPPQLIEIRKHAVAAAFELDKQTSTFVGRPPRLTKRFCVLESPADVPDSALGGSTEAFEAAKRSIGPSGWNAEENVFPATMQRATIEVYTVRELALELALGLCTTTFEQQAQEALRQSEAVWAQMPSFLRYDYTSWDTLSYSRVMSSLLVRMEHTYSEFLIYKMLVHRTGQFRNECLRRAYSVLAMTLDAVKKEDKLTEHRVDIEWLTVYHAMPCVNVLILELYRHQTQQPQTTLAISRTALIIDLSTFISCCDWLSDPGHANFEVCRQAQAIFKRALDFILEPIRGRAAPWHAAFPKPNKIVPAAQAVPASTTTTSMPSSEGTPTDVPQESVDEYPAFIDADFAAWLNSYDVQMTSWLDGAGSPWAAQ